MFKKSTSFLFLCAALATATACKKDSATTPASTKVDVSATINGAQEVPATNSMATGTMTGTYDKSTHVLTYTVTYQGITPAAGHIHVGAPGVNGGVAVPFSSVASSPITGTATLSDADANSLMSNTMYVNFHSQAYKDGEIRGNITMK